MVRQSEKLLSEIFPSEAPFPNLLELESKAALIMNAGNTFLGDGLRPVMPNNLLVGMMNCNYERGNTSQEKLLPQKLQVHR